MNRTVAALLALWMVAGMVLAAAHQAETAHATLTDGTVVHVAGADPAQAHAACQEHSPTSTLDHHAPPVGPADPCWIGDVVQHGLAQTARFDRVVIAGARAALAFVPPAPPAATAVLRFAPKTSPPA